MTSARSVDARSPNRSKTALPIRRATQNSDPTTIDRAAHGQRQRAADPALEHQQHGQHDQAERQHEEDRADLRVIDDRDPDERQAGAGQPLQTTPIGRNAKQRPNSAADGPRRRGVAGRVAEPAGPEDPPPVDLDLERLALVDDRSPTGITGGLNRSEKTCARPSERAQRVAEEQHRHDPVQLPRATPATRPPRTPARGPRGTAPPGPPPPAPSRCSGAPATAPARPPLKISQGRAGNVAPPRGRRLAPLVDHHPGDHPEQVAGDPDQRADRRDPRHEQQRRQERLRQDEPLDPAPPRPRARPRASRPGRGFGRGR